MPRDDFDKEIGEAIKANVYHKLQQKLGVPQLPEGTVTILFTEVEQAGDSFMAAFSTARRAVACALDIQRTLAADRAEQMDAAVQVRIGMDTGEVLAEEQRYFGSTVFRAARIADLASAGRILVSEATKVLASQAGFEFDDLGEHELKGLGSGHRLYEVTAGPARPD